MKRCKKCGKTLPLSEFYRMPEMRDGHRNDCKRCNNAAKAARYRANPDPAKNRTKTWREQNRDRYRAGQREYRQSERGKRAGRKSYLKRKFGITPEEYDRMLAEQGGVCAICGRPPRPDISLHVDHDHETGRIRGILCFRCNNSIGDLDDDPERLQKAMIYLVEHDPEMQEMAVRAKERVKQLVASGNRSPLF